MSNQTQSKPPVTFFSPLDFGTKTSDELTITTSTSTSTSSSPPTSPQPPSVSNSGALTPSSSISTYTQTNKGVHYSDEGEKDKNGNVITAAKEPCADCGGKIVWATKGQWLMVCQGCGEPQ